MSTKPAASSRLVVASGGIAYEAYPEGFYEMIASITPEMMLNSPFDEEFLKFGKTKEDFVALSDRRYRARKAATVPAGAAAAKA